MIMMMMQAAHLFTFRWIFNKVMDISRGVVWNWQIWKWLVSYFLCQWMERSEFI